jgi:hypothetical protein
MLSFRTTYRAIHNLALSVRAHKAPDIDAETEVRQQLFDDGVTSHHLQVRLLEQNRLHGRDCCDRRWKLEG